MYIIIKFSTVESYNSNLRKPECHSILCSNHFKKHQGQSHTYNNNYCRVILGNVENYSVPKNTWPQKKNRGTYNIDNFKDNHDRYFEWLSNNFLYLIISSLHYLVYLSLSLFLILCSWQIRFILSLNPVYPRTLEKSMGWGMQV